jgi:hypothetical protein
MELIKRITSAIFLALIIALPLALLESLMVTSIVRLYEIPYLVNFKYYQILGISFILMMTRNRIKIAEKDQRLKEFLPEILGPSLNRLFRIIFVWVVALAIHQIFLK